MLRFGLCTQGEVNTRSEGRDEGLELWIRGKWGRSNVRRWTCRYPDRERGRILACLERGYEIIQGMHTDPDFYAIIPAGGAGSRLWPLSRAAKPKFLLDLTSDGRTLIQNTWDRLLGVCRSSHIAVSTGVRYADAVLSQLPGLAENNIFAEPVGRDSMAAIALAAAVLAKRHGRSIIIGSFAADHVITDNSRFCSAVSQAIAAARAGFITTIGITPGSPSTAFGYIRGGEPLPDIGRPGDSKDPENPEDPKNPENTERAQAASASAGIAAGRPKVFRVESFVEKPDHYTAKAYVTSGKYRWNAGIFIMQAGSLLDALEGLHPHMYSQIMEIAGAWDTPEQESTMLKVWPGIEKTAFDYAIAEPVAQKGGVAVVPGDFGWKDIGDFASLSSFAPVADSHGNRILLAPADNTADNGNMANSNGMTDGSPAGGARLVSAGSSGNLVVSTQAPSGKVVALVGLEDTVVVDTPDALLVMPKSKAQDVRAVSGILENKPEN